MKHQYAKRKSLFEKFFATHRRIPAYSEMMELFQIKSKNTIHHLVNRFCKDGLISKDDKGKLIPGNLIYGTKLLGSITAGFPSPAEEEIIDTINLDEFLIRNREATYLLTVSGDSMIEAGIHPGDMVLVEKGKIPQHGDIIVAEVDEEWTIKRFVKEKSKVYLKPENPKYKPIIPKEHLKLGGVVISVIRKYH